MTRARAQTSKAPMPVSVRCRRGGRSSTAAPWLFNTLLMTSSFCPGSMEQVLKTRRPPSGLSSESAVSISRNCVFASRLSRPLDQFSAAAPQRRMTRARFLDGIFLSFLRNQPDRAPEAFLRLFDRVHADDLVAFLSEAGTLSTDWRVVRALPPAPFLAEVGRLSRDMIGSAPIPRLERRLPSMDPHQGSPQVAASR